MQIRKSISSFSLCLRLPNLWNVCRQSVSNFTKWYFQTVVGNTSHHSLRPRIYTALGFCKAALDFVREKFQASEAISCLLV